MASLLQGPVAIMLIHLAYIMLSRRTLYAYSDIYAAYLTETINELEWRVRIPENRDAFLLSKSV